MIRFVLLDLDGTLLDFASAERTALQHALHTAGLPFSEEILQTYSRINQAMWEKIEKKQISYKAMQPLRFKQLLETFSWQGDAENILADFRASLSRAGFLLPGAVALLQALHGKYRLFAASNGGTAIQASRLRAAGIDKYFEGAFFSEVMGASKPEPAFFEGCFRQCPEIKKSETVMVGDSLTSDIVGGNRAGLTTVWLRRGEERDNIHPAHTIESLAELPALLEKL